MKVAPTLSIFNSCPTSSLTLPAASFATTFKIIPFSIPPGISTLTSFSPNFKVTHSSSFPVNV